MTPISARSRKPIVKPVGIESSSARLVGSEDRRLALRHHVARAAHGVGRVGVDDVAGHQPIKQHAQRGQVLFHRGRGELTLLLLDEGGDVEGLDLRELVEVVGLAPFGEAAGRVEIGFARVVVVDLGGEEFEDALRRFRRRREQPGRDQAGGGGNDELAGRGELAPENETVG